MPINLLSLLSKAPIKFRDTQVFRPPRLSGFYRYVRIDFLTHYGTEHYCPVSLLRVYGLTQLDSWRRDQERERIQRELLTKVADIAEGGEIELEMEEGAEQDEEVVVEVVGSSEQTGVDDVSQTRAANNTLSPTESETTSVLDTSEVSGPTLATSLDSTPTSKPQPDIPASSEVPSSMPSATESSVEASSTSSSLAASSSPLAEATLSSVTSFDDNSTLASSESLATPSANVTLVDEHGSANSTALGDTPPSPTAPSSSMNATSRTLPDLSVTREPTRSAHTAPPPPPPAAQTTQGESIYGTIMKRLSALEHNATLSLRYVEEQGMLLKEAFLRMEHRLNDVDGQVTTFFVRQTWYHFVLTDLRWQRSKQDQLLRRIVLDLDLHRAKVEQERIALASQVNLLSKEVSRRQL
jgi:hypothetical protein